MGSQSSEGRSAKRPTSKDFSFFDREEARVSRPGDAGDLNETIALPEGLRGRVDLNEHFRGQAEFRTILAHADDDGYSLYEAAWAPDFVVPRHYHDSDQLIYVVEGEIFMGNRRLGPGAGFFLPAGHPYGYTAGADGARIIEFRHAPAHTTVFVETDPERFATPAAGSPAARARS